MNKSLWLIELVTHRNGGEFNDWIYVSDSFIYEGTLEDVKQFKRQFGAECKYVYGESKEIIDTTIIEYSILPAIRSSFPQRYDRLTRRGWVKSECDICELNPDLNIYWEDTKNRLEWAMPW